ncbi:hypothetical protein [Thiomonas delicata]|uniref:hypothetical protein n=1 Tax=Thiomonas delicata TaxID=364030 RepID=UPI001C96F4DC|nr:hypothetical protein [Thiomonas delicata]
MLGAMLLHNRCCSRVKNKHIAIPFDVSSAWVGEKRSTVVEGHSLIYEIPLIDAVARFSRPHAAVEHGCSGGHSQFGVGERAGHAAQSVVFVRPALRHLQVFQRPRGGNLKFRETSGAKRIL